MGGFDSRQLQEMLAQTQKQAQELQQKMQQTIVEASSGGGSVTVKMLPAPGALAQSTAPRCASAIHLTMERPRPNPPAARDRASSVR